MRASDLHLSCLLTSGYIFSLSRVGCYATAFFVVPT